MTWVGHTMMADLCDCYRAGYGRGLDVKYHGREPDQMFAEWLEERGALKTDTAQSAAALRDFRLGYRHGREDFDKSDYHC